MVYRATLLTRQLLGAEKVYQNVFVFNLDVIKNLGYHDPEDYVSIVIHREMHDIKDKFPELNNAKFAIEEIDPDNVIILYSPTIIPDKTHMNHKTIIVHRQLPTHEKVVHKVFVYDEDELKQAGYDAPSGYIQSIIDNDIKEFKEKFVEFKRAEFTTQLLEANEVVVVTNKL